MPESPQIVDRLKRIVEGSKDGLWDWDLETNEFYMNDQAYLLLDIQKENGKPLHQSILSRIVPEDRAYTISAMRALMEKGMPYQIEHRIALGDDTFQYCLCRGQVTQYNEEGKPTKISGTITDITHLKQTEAALQVSQQRLNRVIEGSNDGIWDWDVIQDSFFWSDRLYDMLGLTKAETPINYQIYQFLIAEEDKARVNAAMARTLSLGLPFLEEFKLRHASGIYRDFYSRAKPYYDRQGKLNRVAGMLSDITERKQAQEALAKSEEHFRFVTDTVPVMLWLTDENHSTIYINRTWQEFTGQTEDEVLGFGWLEKLHPEDRQQACDSFIQSTTRRDMVRLEYRLLRQDGEYRHVLDVGAPLIEHQGIFQGYIGYVIDITERKQAEFALLESECRFRTLAETSTAMIWQTDANSRMIYQNPKLLEFIGFHTENASCSDWTSYFRSGDITVIAQKLTESAESQQEFTLEVEMWHAPTAAYRWLKSSGKPLYAENGDFLGIVGISIDIHDLKQIQEKLLKATQKLSQSNRDLAQFAAVASHDLKAPLRKINIFSTQLALEKDKLTLDSQDALMRIQKAMEVLQILIDDLLSWAKINHTPVAAVSNELSDILEKVLTNLKPTIQESKAQITIGQMETVYGDPSQLEQLLQNLLENALKYQPPLQQPVIFIDSAHSNDQYCQIIVQDNGIGFPQEQAERIFQPFERLHGKASPYPGSGVGLAICQRIVERHGGNIEAQSKDGKGAKFIVNLPLESEKTGQPESLFSFINSLS